MTWQYWLTIWLWVSPPLLANTYSLSELFRKALLFHDQYRNAEIDQQIAEKEKRDAYASVMPTLTAEASYLRRDFPQATAGFAGSNAASQLSLLQRIFQGGAEYKAIELAGNLPELAEKAKKLSKLSLFDELSGIYLEAYFQGQLVDLLARQRDILEQQVKTLSQQVQIGRSRSTDLLRAQSRRASIEAQRSSAYSELQSFRQRLRQFTGVERIQDLQEPSMPSPSYQVSSGSVATHPAILQQELLLKNARLQVAARRGEYLPNVELRGNLYFDRTGPLASSEWDVAIQANWELFSGGDTMNRVDILLFETRKIENRLQKLKNDLQVEQTRLIEKYQLDRKALQDLAKAEKMAEKNYRTFVQEEKKALVNSLEVLQATEDYLEVAKAHLLAKKQLAITRAQLALAFGETL